MNRGKIQHNTVIKRIATILLILFILLSLVSIFWTPYSVYTTNGFATFEPYSVQHILGTDSMGRDLLSLIMVGLGSTMFYGLICAILSSLLGNIFSFFLTRRFSNLILTISDIIITIPVILLALIMWVVIGSSPWICVFACSFGLVFKCLRMLAPQVFKIKKEEFYILAISSGASYTNRFFYHILPNMKDLIWIQFTISFIVEVSAESGLSYIGISPASKITLGTILSESVNFIRIHPSISIIPALVLSLLIWSVANIKN